MGWRLRNKKAIPNNARTATGQTTAQPPGDAPQPKPLEGAPKQSVAADGVVQEESAAMGRSVLIPGGSERIALRAEAPGGSRGMRR